MGLPPDSQPIAEAKPSLGLPVGYLPIDEAPDDGKHVLLTDGMKVLAGRYRHTRMFDRQGGQWRVTGVWCRRQVDGGGPLGFTPIGFRAIPDNWGFEAGT